MTPSACQQQRSIPSDSLKISNDSHVIKKPLSSSSISSNSSSTTNTTSSKHQPQEPIIIYTHSPRTIRTNPKDFKALVQKLTGLPASESKNLNNHEDNKTADHNGRLPISSGCNAGGGEEDKNHNEASLIVSADETNPSLQDIGAPSIFDLSNPFQENMSLFVSNRTDILCRNDPINYDYMDLYLPYN